MFAGFCRDLTEVKKYENQLLQQKEVSENILKSIFPSQVAQILMKESMLFMFIV